MPRFTITAPDGKTFNVDGPEGATAEQALQQVQAQYGAAPAAPAAEPTVFDRAGELINGLPRQLGLGTRSLLKGAAQAVEPVTEPLRNFVTDPLLRMFGGKGSQPLSATAGQAADTVGLPTPATKQERIMDEVNSMGASALTGLGGAGALSKVVGAAPLVANEAKAGSSALMNRLRDLGNASRGVPEALTQGPGVQMGAAMGAGGLGAASKENGGSAGQQALAGLVGGVAGGLGVAGAQSALQAGKAFLGKLTPAMIDQQITATLERSGVDYSAVPERVKQSLRADLAGSLRAGRELDPAAIQRRIDFQTVGATPTRGTVSLDPVQITQEKNLAKMAAASGSATDLHSLPRIENANNAQMISFLNGAGAPQAGSGAAMSAGQAAIDAINGTAAARGAEVKSAYDAVRAMPGGDMPISPGPIADSIYKALDAKDLTAFLPSNVSTFLDGFTKGGAEMTPGRLNNLLTVISTEQRSAQGSAKAALSTVRDALMDAPIVPAGKAMTGETAPVTQGIADVLRAHDAMPGAVMEGYGNARNTARQNFAWREGSTPVVAALDGAAPDAFFRQHFIAAPLRSAEALVSEMGANTEPLKTAALAHLKEAAIGKGTADEVGKFSARGYTAALDALGPKLSLLFTPEEVNQLQAAGRVANYLSFQPVGSAVNNSNSATTILGKALDLVGKGSKYLPLGLDKPVNSVVLNIGQRQALKTAPGLLQALEPKQRTPGLVLPAMGIAGQLENAN